jgi:hypothetical protein
MIANMKRRDFITLIGGTVRQSALAVFNVDNRLDWSTVTMAHSTFMSASRTMRV